MDLQDEQFHIDDQPAPNKRPRPRFLGDEEDNIETVERPVENDAGSLDGYFDDLDDSRLPAPLNHEEIEANLAAKKVAPSDPGTSTNPDQPKRVVKRRPIVKIDENRLCDPKIGIPKLIQISQGFKPSGKGKEKEDLKKLLKMYRLWSHDLFPKGTFIDNIETIEKKALGDWREEYLESRGKKTQASVAVDDGPSNAPSDRPVQSTSNQDPMESSNARSPVDGPLFRPESDDEFPMDQDIELILNNINTS